jgi:hypothetical protein
VLMSMRIVGFAQKCQDTKNPTMNEQSWKKMQQSATLSRPCIDPT